MILFNPDREEYKAARAGTVYIVLNRGLLRGTGADRLDLLHRLSTNATRDLKGGDETSTILTSDKGRIVDVLRILAFEDHILILLSEPDTSRTRSFLDKYTIMDDFATEDVSEAYGVIGLYGERARSLVAGATVQEIPDAGHFTVSRTEAGEIITLRDTRLNGAGGFLLLVPRGEMESVIAKLRALGATPMERATYETLRVENGVPSPGRELTETYNPLEAGLTTLISWTKGCYIGQEVIARLDSYDKVQRHLVGLTLDESPGSDGIEELEVESPDDGKKIGRVTSLAFSPELGLPIALAYIRTQYAIPGTRVGLVAPGEGGGPVAGATITRLPFDL